MTNLTAISARLLLLGRLPADFADVLRRSIELMGSPLLINCTNTVELFLQWIESEELRGRADFVMVPAGADADGDGASNSSKFHAGTNPTNSTSVARLALDRSGTNSSLRFRKPAHRSALIQPSETLGASALWWPWPEGAVPEFPIAPREWRLPASSLESTQRFFRVRLNTP